MKRFDVYMFLFFTVVLAFNVQSSDCNPIFVVLFVTSCCWTGVVAGGAFWYPLIDGWEDCSNKWRKFAEEEHARYNQLLAIAKQLQAERDSGDWWKDKP